MPQDDPFTPCDLDMGDYDAIMQLWEQAGLPARADGRDAPAALARQIAEAGMRLVGVRDGDRLIGVAMLTHDGRKGWINRLAVDPAYRRRGIGTLLVMESERWFRQELGLEVFAALILEDNDPSLTLFEALGYQRLPVAYVTRRTRPEA